MQWLRGEPHADLVRHRAHGDTGVHGAWLPRQGKSPAVARTSCSHWGGPSAEHGDGVLGVGSLQDGVHLHTSS